MKGAKPTRSLQTITGRDLVRLANLARKDREEFIARSGRTNLRAAYRCTALCQGAALHYLNGRNGIKDFDVWTFYAGTSRTFPARRILSVDLGNAKFGTSSDRPDFVGRRVDLLGRGIPFRKSKNADEMVESVRDYLSKGATASARALAEKAVILIDPPQVLGRVVWPIPVEDMLDTLASCGIRPRRDVMTEDIKRSNYGEPLADGETSTYLELLGRLGFERAKPPHDDLSDNIWYLDAECIYDPDAYTRIIQRMVRMTRGKFPVRRIQSHLDWETGRGELSFMLGTDKFRWPIHVNRDWIDGNLVARFAKLFSDYQRQLRFTFYNLHGQDCLMGSATPEEIQLLRKRASVWFAVLDYGMI